jgi:alpha-glucosidase
VLHFWLDRGVDGFRVDVMHHIIKDSEFRDNPPNPNFQHGMSPYRELLTTYSADRPEVHEIVGAMRAVIEKYDDRMLVGEIYLPVERLIAYYGASGRGAHLPFNFQLISLPWQARAISDAMARYYALLPARAWPNWVLGNHDKPRLVSRIGAPQARVAAMLLLTLRGTPTLYYGDEIGMHSVPISAAQVRDPFEKNVPGLGLGRDPVRTPMQWDSTPNGGFSTAEPWLPLAADYATTNVAVEETEPASLLMLYRRLIDLRRQEPALSVGELVLLPAGENIVAYIRKADSRRLLVVLNLSAARGRFDLSDLRCGARIRLSTHLTHHGNRLEDYLELRPDEGMICELE